MLIHVCPCACECLSINLYINRPICLSVYQPNYLCIYKYICPFGYLFNIDFLPPGTSMSSGIKYTPPPQKKKMKKKSLFPLSLNPFFSLRLSLSLSPFLSLFLSLSLSLLSLYCSLFFSHFFSLPITIFYSSLFPSLSPSLLLS